MKYNSLGKSKINVSEICLGSMTWGTQNNFRDAKLQIDIATGYGVNFIDTAELYPTTPLSPASQGETELIIGKYFAETKRRNDFVIATKISGSGVPHIRNGSKITPTAITEALHQSLQRLQTDYIDLYQLHWPNRGHYHFRKSWKYNPKVIELDSHYQETSDILGRLQRHIQEGKIRTIGLSNETAWGTASFLKTSTDKNLPRVASIQNEYSLLCRWFDLDLAELSRNENVGLLAYSPLAAGILTGKYIDGAVPKNSRASIKPGLDGRLSQHIGLPLRAYMNLAKDMKIKPEQLALAFCLTRPFMTSVIIGATTEQQLRSALQCVEVKMDKAALDGIQDIYRQYPAPM